MSASTDATRLLDLRAFLDLLRREGELVEVEAPVDPYLEVAELHRRVIAGGGPALLFRRPAADVELRRHVAGETVALLAGGDPTPTAPAVAPPAGYDLPLVTNLFGTQRRVELAFGRRPERLLRRLVEATETLLPPSPAKLWGARDLLGAALRVGFRNVRRGPVTERASRDVDLGRLPITTSWPGDGGPFLTLPLVYTEHPEGHAKSNLGIYRMQVHGPRSAGMHWQIAKGGGFHYAAAEARGEALPVTVFLGGPPALLLAAVAPLPENVPELLLASLVAGARLPRVRGAGPHPLLAGAELALSGVVLPRKRLPEGPFGDHYGYYSLRHDYPVFEAESLFRRADAILPATVVGKPRQEDFFLGDFLQELLSPLFPLAMPGVRDLWSYGETGYHSLAAAVVRERYRREAMVSAFRILGEGQLALTKMLLLTDRAVDLRDFRATLAHVLARTHVESDLFVFGNLSMDTLDYTGPRVNEGSKAVWLGLGEPVRELPRAFDGGATLPPGIGEAHVFCPGCLVLGADPRLPRAGEAGVDEALRRIAAHAAFAPWPLLVLSDEPRRAAASPINFLWTTFTRCEPAADLHAAATRVVRNQLSYTAPVLLDARTKHGFPAELTSSPAVAAQVTRRWSEYFPRGGVAMGDAERGHLD
ncbi:MAG TPA: UbiD family decarboxylase [Thermoanaerobaculia bacterium]|nr:UbiD family decarboxylase [Thermoanaerobaculia bacterium]